MIADQSKRFGTKLKTASSQKGDYYEKSNAYFLILAIPVMLSLNIHFAFAAEEASSIMCDNGVVNIGDMQAAVQDACGEPNSQSMNEWTYNFGPSQPVYTLIFKEGQLIKILENEWGS